MSNSNSTIADTERTTSRLEAAAQQLREPGDRHFFDQFTLVPQHVGLQGLIIRQGINREVVASGVRVLIRSLPVGELPSSSDEPQSRFPVSWFDPVPEGKPIQRSTELFVDQQEIAELTTGLRRFQRVPERWSTYPLGDLEAVYAWERRLVFRTVRRRSMEEHFLSCATEPTLNLRIPAWRTSELIQWLNKISAVFAEDAAE